MSLSSQASLGGLRLQAMQRSSLENNPSVSTAEWNSYISNSYKELYDLLVSAYGNDYYVQTPYQFTLTGASLYSLPTDFYKLLGVDIQYSASPTGWVTLKRFEFIDRNKASYLSSAVNISGLARAWYIPEPSSLQIMPICSTTLNSTTVSVSNSADLSVGMSIFGSAIQTNTTIVSINTGANTIVISRAALATQPIIILQMWTDAAQIDGISGWEEYVIIDAAIKGAIKCEFEVTELVRQKAEMKMRIEAMAEGRDAGQAHHSSDVMNLNGDLFGLGGLGIGNIKYRLVGSQIQLAAVGDDTTRIGY